MEFLKKLDEINHDLSLLCEDTDYELHLSIIFDNGANGWILIELICHEENSIKHLEDTWDFGNFEQDYESTKKEILPTLNTVYQHLIDKFNERGFESIRESIIENN